MQAQPARALQTTVIEDFVDDVTHRVLTQSLILVARIFLQHRSVMTRDGIQVERFDAIERPFKQLL